MVNIERTSNGYLVICENLPTSTISVSFDIKAGSGQDKIFGMAHYLEHIIFAGNKEYPKSKVREIFGKYCAKYNGSTSIENTRFYIKCIDKYFEECFCVMASILSDPGFDDDKIKTEYGVIVEEINRYKDIYSDKVCENARSMFFADTQYDHDTLGTPQTISKINKENLQDFYRNNYTTANIIISFAGNITINQAKHLVEKYMKSTTSGSINSRVSFNENYDCKPNKNVIYANTTQSHICIMQKGINYGDTQYYAYLVYLALFGGSSDNFLIKMLRDKYGYVYSCYSYVEEYLNVAILSTYCACNKENIDKTIDLIFKIQNDMPNLITKEQVDNAKLALEISLLMTRDKPLSVATSNAIDYKHFSKVFDYNDIVKDIQKVSLDDVINVAKKFVNHKNNIVSIISSK